MTMPVKRHAALAFLMAAIAACAGTLSGPALEHTIGLVYFAPDERAAAAPPRCGEQPRNIPFEEVAVKKLVLNQEVAKALGITLLLCAFTAAMFLRTPTLRDHWQAQWREAYKIGEQIMQVVDRTLHRNGIVWSGAYRTAQTTTPCRMSK